MRSTVGFTLVELIVALVAGGIVAALAVGILLGQRRAWWEQMWRTDGHATVRVAQLVIPSEMRGTVGDSGVSGISVLTNGSAVYRANKSLHFVCSAVLAGDSVLAVWSDAVGSRKVDPIVDSLLVRQNSGHWSPFGIRAVGAGLCPDGRQSVSFALAAPAVVAIDRGTPVRAFETAEIRGYRSGPAWWIGMRRARTSGGWPSIQPALGPISTRGLEFLAFDSSQTPVLAPAQAVGLEFRVGLNHPSQSGARSWFISAFRLRNAQ